MVRARWGILVAGALLVVAGVAWGAGVFGHLSGGGFNDPDSESSSVRAQLTQVFGPQEPDVLALYSSPSETVTDPDFQRNVTAALDRVKALPGVASVMSYYDTQSPALVSGDRHATYAAITLGVAPGGAKPATYADIKAALRADGGVQTQYGGNTPFQDEANKMTTSDIQRAEEVSTPILLVLLVLIFGSVVAAASPLLIGGVAIMGAFIVVRLISQVTDVSTFAINIITLIGLGLSIDYALFVVTRFRDELAGKSGDRQSIPKPLRHPLIRRRRRQPDRYLESPARRHPLAPDPAP